MEKVHIQHAAMEKVHIRHAVMEMVHIRHAVMEMVHIQCCHGDGTHTMLPWRWYTYVMLPWRWYTYGMPSWRWYTCHAAMDTMYIPPARTVSLSAHFEALCVIPQPCREPPPATAVSASLQLSSQTAPPRMSPVWSLIVIHWTVIYRRCTPTSHHTQLQ